MVEGDSLLAGLLLCLVEGVVSVVREDEPLRVPAHLLLLLLLAGEGADVLGAHGGHESARPPVVSRRSDNDISGVK